ncbi:unnamed protein product [Polarella glacialis]|uniref:Uncharacterized protein n=1 Tax=Polarella glacialis TaxID=89957 RepID=A0A813H367_POLGL|nr:unnamed protein product [Polarella glacialis]
MSSSELDRRYKSSLAMADFGRSAQDSGDEQERPEGPADRLLEEIRIRFFEGGKGGLLAGDPRTQTIYECLAERLLQDEPGDADVREAGFVEPLGRSSLITRFAAAVPEGHSSCMRMMIDGLKRHATMFGHAAASPAEKMAQKIAALDEDLLAENRQMSYRLSRLRSASAAKGSAADRLAGRIAPCHSDDESEGEVLVAVGSADRLHDLLAALCRGWASLFLPFNVSIFTFIGRSLKNYVPSDFTPATSASGLIAAAISIRGHCSICQCRLCMYLCM